MPSYSDACSFAESTSVATTILGCKWPIQALWNYTSSFKMSIENQQTIPSISPMTYAMKTTTPWGQSAFPHSTNTEVCPMQGLHQLGSWHAGHQLRGRAQDTSGTRRQSELRPWALRSLTSNINQDPGQTPRKSKDAEMLSFGYPNSTLCRGHRGHPLTCKFLSYSATLHTFERAQARLKSPACYQPKRFQQERIRTPSIHQSLRGESLREKYRRLRIGQAQVGACFALLEGSSDRPCWSPTQRTKWSQAQDLFRGANS